MHQTFKIKDLGVILKPSKEPFEEMAVLNPGIVQEGDLLHMFYRAVDKKGSSTIGYCQLKKGKVIYRSKKPVLTPEFSWEKQGVEDPRVMKMGDTYYIFYTAFDGQNARIAYGTTKKLPFFKKRGLISPSFAYDEAENLFRGQNLQEKYFLFESFYKQKHGENVLLWEKDAFLLPEKIKGKFVLFHRILPGIQIITFDRFSQLTDGYWRRYMRKLCNSVVLDPENWFEIRNIGGGAAPIKTKAGWLLIYHAVEDNREKGRVYHAAAALLDKHNPLKVIGRLHHPLFSPEKPWEEKGIVNNVIFPTATVLEGKDVIIYYGSADKVIAAKSIKLEELIRDLKSHPPRKY